MKLILQVKNTLLLNYQQRLRIKEGAFNMIEIPESYTISQQLNNTIKGKTIMNVYANSSPHKFAWYFGGLNNYHILLAGKKIDCAKAYAGLVEIQAENARILMCDGVNIRYFKSGEKLPNKHQLHIEFEDFSSLVCSVQMYGAVSYTHLRAH